MIKLSNRLSAIAEMSLPLGSRFCDVGTDHAYIPIYLMQNGAQGVIATDIKEGPVNIAQENVSRFGLSGYIQVRQGYGLDPLGEGEADAVIIAGMGGGLISEILSRGAPSGVKYFTLQPMTGVPLLREWLINNNFRIVDERLACEGRKIYNIILTTHGDSEQMTPFELYIGKCLIEKRDALLPMLLDRERCRLERIPEDVRDCEMLKKIKELSVWLQ